MRIFFILSLLIISGCSGDDIKAPTDGRVSLFEQRNILSSDLRGIYPELPPRVMNSDWGSEGGLTFRDLGHLVGPNEFKKPLWKSDVGTVSSGVNETTSQPIISEGRVFVLNSDNELYALNALTGDEIWKKELNHSDDDANFRGGGIASEGGYVFITTGNGYVYALSAKNGKEIWRLDNRIPFGTAPMFSNGILYVVDRDNRLQAIDAFSGNVLWDHRGLPEIAVAPRIASVSIVGNVLVAPFTSGEINIFDTRRASVAWGRNVADRFGNIGVKAFKTISANPIISNKMIFTGSVLSPFMSLSGSDGRMVWQNKDIFVETTPLSAGEVIYVIDSKSRFIAMRKSDGRIFHVNNLSSDNYDEDHIRWTSPLMLNDKIVTFSDNGKVLIINPKNGEIISTDQTPETSVDPSVSKGILYLLSKDGSLYAYGSS